MTITNYGTPSNKNRNIRTRTSSASSPLIFAPLLWLDGQDVNATGSNPSDGTAIASWKDKSGNGNNYTQATGANQPAFLTNGINGKPSVYFSGSPKGMLGSVISTNLHTVFIVCKADSVGTDQYVWFNGAGDGYGYWIDGSSKRTILLGGILGKDDGNQTTNEEIISFDWDGSTAHFWMNGISETISTPTVAASAPSTRSQIGFNGGSGTGNYPGKIGEIIVYNRALTTSERQQVEAYLSNKWDIAVNNPLALSPLLLLDASAISGKSDGEKLASWSDISGNSYTPTQGTGANQPTYNTSVQNSLPCLTFNGTSSFMTIPAGFLSELTTEVTVFIALKQTSSDATNGNAILFNNPDNAANRFNTSGIYTASGTNTYWDFGDINGGGRIFTDNSDLGVLNTPYVWTYTVAGGTEQSIYSDGVQIVTGVQGGTGAFTTETCLIGKFGASGFIGMQLFQIVIYNYRLNAAEQAFVENYLTNKWGI